ncbi:hypothetical protein ACP3TJ_10365 [Desulforudis sp. 1088]|uniref:hypothetical protein n=1 Tax=unclassified Candidatus Desulforudis TaxID=2635950 RepID=UPI003CE4EBD2
MPFKDPERHKAYHREYSRRWYQRRKAEREAARQEAAKAQKRFLLRCNPSNPAALEEALARLMDHPLTALETHYLRHLVKTHGLDEVWHAVAAVFAATGQVTFRSLDLALHIIRPEKVNGDHESCSVSPGRIPGPDGAG